MELGPVPERLESKDAAFRIIDRLRPGGLCELYVAEGLRGPSAGERCVLKTLRPDRWESPEHFKGLVSEGAILARLSHPNIVALRGSVYLDGRPWLVIEHVEGVSLGALMEDLRARGRVLPRSVAYAVLLQLLEALGYLHGALDPRGAPLSLRHRDVTPGNLMLTWGGATKLLDFGLSQWIHADEVQAEGVVHGTPGYLAPEQLLGEPFTDRGDVFAAGVVGMAMLSDGRSPFARPTVQQSVLATLHGRRISAHDLVSQIPRGVAELLEASLDPSPMARPGAAAMAMDLLGELERLGTGPASAGEIQQLLAALYPDAPIDAADAAEGGGFEELSATSLLGIEGEADFELGLPEPEFKVGPR